MEMVAATQVCTKCKIEKPISEYHKSTTTPDGFRHICKKCRSFEYGKKAMEKIIERLQNPKNIEELTHKTCCKCGIVKSLDMFYKHESKKDGFRNDCKVCRSIASRAYVSENKERVYERHRKYSLAHKEALATWNREWRLQHIEQYKQKDKDYRKSHPIEISERNKKYVELHKKELLKYGKTYRDTHKENTIAWSKQYYTDNKMEISRKKKLYMATEAGKLMDARHGNRRRSQFLKTECTLTLRQWNKILEMQQYKCNGCGLEFTSELSPTRDHIIPLSMGGGLTFGNVQALCKPCNSRKHNKVGFMKAIDTLLVEV